MTQPHDNNTIDAVAPREEPPFALTLPQRQKVVLVMDLVESVRLMAANEVAVIDHWRGFVRYATSTVLPRHSGRLVKSLGDGIMAEFDSAREATAAALVLHRHFDAANAQLPAEQKLYLRAGLNATHVYVDDIDIYGSGVNLAARVASLAGPGETMVTAEVRDGLTDGLDVEMQDMGDCHLKHVAVPVRAYRIGASGPSPILTPLHEYLNPLEPKIAVMIFQSKAEAGNIIDYEAQILAEEIIARLAISGEMRVVSRLSTAALTGHVLSIERIAELLGAHFVLHGNYVRVGAKIRVFAELIEARTGSLVWVGAPMVADDPSWCFDDDLVSQIAQGIVGAIRTREVQKARSQPFPTLNSYSLMMGSIAMMHRASARDFKTAHDMLESLLSRHARLSRPHAWLANWHALSVTQGYTQNAQHDSDQALRFAGQALDLDPECSLALAIDGILHANLRKDMAIAMERLDAAISVNPNESIAWLFKAGVHAFVGEGQEAEAASSKASSLSPLDPLRHYYDVFSATASLSAGNYERAIHFALRSLRVNRMHASTHRVLAIAQALSGAMGDARETLKSLRALLPDYTVATFKQDSPYAAGPHADEFARALAAAGLPAA